MAWALKLPLADEVIESGLVQDFDASLSGIGQELGAGAYSMRYSSSFCCKIYVSILQYLSLKINASCMIILLIVKEK